MITILGENVSLVRPERIKRPNIYKNERPIIKYNKRSKNLRAKPKRVPIACLVQLASGGVRGVTSAPGITHLTVVQVFGVNTKNIAASGWEFKDGSREWR